MEIISIWMLREDQVDNFNPILMEVFLSNLMSADIIGSEPLHSEVVNETMLLKIFNILSNIFVRNGFWNKSEGHWEPVATQLS